MMNQRANFFVVLLLACIALIGCGGSTAVSPVMNSAPSISSISPKNIVAGSAGFNLLLSGQGLSTTSSVHFGSDVLSAVAMQACASGSNCETIAVPIPAKDVTTAGPVNVFVVNSSLTSNTVVFTVTAQPSPASTPQILAFVPTVAPAGGATFTMVIIGVNVSPGAIVNFGSLQLTPTSLLNCNPGEICPELVQVPASAIATAGQVSLSLTNPGAIGGTSGAVPFLVLAKTTFPVEESVNNVMPVAPANGNSTHSSVSGGAAVVAFDSTATNLVAGATSGLSQVYVRNNCFAGQTNCVPQTMLISAAPDNSAGTGGVQGSDKPVISIDGRYVAFQSDDTNLVSGVTQPVEQIYLRDTCNSILGPVPGCTPSTTLISASPTGAPGNAPSLNPTISVLGFFVAFQSTATNLGGVPVPAGLSQIYLSRQCPALPVLGQIPGCTGTLAAASLDATGNAGDKDSVNPSLDPIGFALLFQSKADNIVANTPGNGFDQIYGRNTCFLLMFPGITLPCPNVTVDISVDSSGQLGTGDSVTPSSDFGGLDVAYATRAPNLLPANASSQQIVGTTTCILEESAVLPCSPSNTIVVSVDQNGAPGQADSSNPSIGAGKVGFTSFANLLPNISGQQVYASSSCILSGGDCTLTLVSADSSGEAIGGDFSAMEASGAFATFSTLGSSSSPGTAEIFLAAPFF
jgi:hypothetical protein